MLKSNRAIVLVAASLAVAGVAGAGIFQAITLKRVPKVGEVYKYSLKGTFDFSGMEISVSGLSTEKVLAVEGDTYTVESASTDTKVSVGGQEMEQPAATTKTTYKLSGLATKIEGDEVSSTNYRIDNLSGLHLPEKPVSVGETWTFEQKASDTLGTPAVKVTYKAVALEKFLGFDTLKVEFESKESGNDTPGTMKGIMWIDTATATYVKSEAAWTDITFPGAPVPLSGKLTMTRIP
jgi:hypothetical protein